MQIRITVTDTENGLDIDIGEQESITKETRNEPETPPDVAETGESSKETATVVEPAGAIPVPPEFRNVSVADDKERSPRQTGTSEEPTNVIPAPPEFANSG